MVVHRLGLIGFDEAWALQLETHAQRLRDEVPDTVLLLQHPPVVTLGRAAKPEHVKTPPDALQAAGIQLRETGRGGDVTYHGPGQLVAYLIIDLKPDRQDVRRYVWHLEEVMVRVAARFGVTAQRVPGLNGAWVCDAAGERKVGAVGVRISRWVTLHGFALNVDVDLQAFDAIVPCGIADRGVTSLAQEAASPLPLDAVVDATEAALAEVFAAQVVQAPLSTAHAPCAGPPPHR